MEKTEKKIMRGLGVEPKKKGKKTTRTQEELLEESLAFPPRPAKYIVYQNRVYQLQEGKTEVVNEKEVKE